MTGEEFLEQAGEVITPAITSVIEFAFKTVPQKDVGPLIATYLGAATRLTMERVHEIVVETESRLPPAH